MTDRPSDAVTGKVVARQHGIEGDDPFTLIGAVFHYDWNNDFYDDPRESTDAALELLHAITDDECLRKHGEHWMHDTPMFYPECSGWSESFGEPIPLSGEPFRYAVVHLAARVWGVEE